MSCPAVGVNRTRVIRRPTAPRWKATKAARTPGAGRAGRVRASRPVVAAADARAVARPRAPRAAAAKAAAPAAVAARRAPLKAPEPPKRPARKAPRARGKAGRQTGATAGRRKADARN